MMTDKFHWFQELNIESHDILEIWTMLVTMGMGKFWKKSIYSTYSSGRQKSN